MNKSHITPEQIRDFIKGRMPAHLAADFRKRMAADPALEEEVALARLLLSGLEAVAQTKRQRRVLAIVVGIVLLLLLLFAYLYTGRSSKSAPAPAAPGQQVGTSGLPEAITQGGSNSEKFASDRAISLCWNSRGEVIVAGQFEGSPIFGDIRLPGFGSTDIFLAACNQQLNFQWARQFGSPQGDDFLCKIGLDSKDNILMTGAFYNQAQFGSQTFRAIGKSNLGYSDFYIAKLDPQGQLLWLRHNGGNAIPSKQTGDNLGLAVVADQTDHIIAAGMYIGTPKMGNAMLPVGGPNEDLYLCKYTPGGHLLWVKTITSDYQLTIGNLAVDPKNNLYLTGRFGHHNLSGHLYIGQDTLTSYGGQDIFLAKFMPDGKLDWVRQAGGAVTPNGRDFGANLAVDAKGQVYLTGYFEENARFGNLRIKGSGKRDVFLAKYNAAGNVLWVNVYGGSENDHSTGLCLDETGNVYCVGQFTGQAVFGADTLQSNGLEDMFVLKCDPDGNLQWARQAGGNTGKWNSDNAVSISINKNNTLVLTGFFSGTMQLGSKILTSAGREDMFLLFFDTNGYLLEAKRTNHAL